MFGRVVDMLHGAEPIAQLPGSALQHGAFRALELLRERLALHFRGVLTPAECSELVAGVYAGRAAWAPSRAGSEYTLGRNYRTDLEQEQQEEYFAQAASSDALVRHWVPGLQGKMVALLRLLVKDRVAQRAGWCGAGLNILPAGGHCARHGGAPHFNIAGLEPAALSSEAPTISCALMLQPARDGGELQLWDRLYEGEPGIDEAEVKQDSARCSYAAGDLVVVDSRRLHRVAPFGGARDRIIVTLRAVYSKERRLWEVWR